jgi:hypothetical protein
MNLISTYAVLKNGLEYPLFWRFWRKTKSQDDKQTKLELARKMLLDLRGTCRERLWVAMDRWLPQARISSTGWPNITLIFSDQGQEKHRFVLQIL